MRLRSQLMRQSKVFYGWWVVLGLYLVTFSGIVGRFVIGALGPTISRETGWTTSQITLGVTITLLSYAAASIFVGRLIDSIGGRKVVTLGSALLLAGFILLSMVRELWQLYLVYGVLLGVAVSMTQSVPDQSIARKWFVRRAALVGGILATAFSSSQAILFPVLAGVGASSGWRAAVLLCLVPGVVALLASRAVVRDTPESVGLRPYGLSAPGAGNGQAGVEMVEEASVPAAKAVRTAAFWGLCLAHGMYSIPLQGFSANIAFWGESVGASRAGVGLFMAAWAVAAIVGKLIWGLLGDRFDKRRVAIAGSAGCIVAFAAGWLLVRGVAGLFVISVAYGLLYSHCVIAFPYMGDLFGRSSIGTLTGYILAAHAFVGAAGPILWSKIFDATGAYNLACLASAIAYVVVMLGYLMARPPRVKQAAPNG